MDKYQHGCYGSYKGIALIGKVLAGRCKMHYTRVAVGKGTLPEGMTPKTLEEPPEYIMDAQISSVTNPVDGECQVAVQINSANVEKGFYAKWFILYAEDPDDGEIPYTALRMEDEPEWIRPSSSIVGKLAHFDIIAAVGDVDCVTATIDPDALLTLEAAQQMLDNHNDDTEAHAELLKQYVKAGIPGEPGSAAILDDTGKIPAEVLPENTVTLGEDGKISEDILPDSAVLLDETGKVRASYLPDEVFSRSGVRNDTVTIPPSAWQEDVDGPCAYRAEVVFEGATEVHIPYASLDGPSAATAKSCGMCDKAEAANGVLRFWADAAPTEDIIARAALFGPGGGTAAAVSLPLATADSPGAVRPGDGLTVGPDGTLSVNFASEAEANEMLAGIFPDNK